MGKIIDNYFELTDRDWKEDFGYENGNYEHICPECKNRFVGHKRRWQCKTCETTIAEIRREES
jgi:ribosomal protein L37AE/L43A